VTAAAPETADAPETAPAAAEDKVIEALKNKRTPLTRSLSVEDRQGDDSAKDKDAVPQFPWPPPKASTFYVIPDRLFESAATIGDAVNAIIAALERTGYVERSFFQTAADGVALVTRLERINADGSPAAERWPGTGSNVSGAELLSFLRGLFFVDPGHYRIIVFVIQSTPFTQSPKVATRTEARNWLTTGANLLTPAIADRPYKGNHCTALVYEFGSDGRHVSVVDSALTGKQHLDRAGVLTALEKRN
jgi:hypothetical protein